MMHKSMLYIFAGCDLLSDQLPIGCALKYEGVTHGLCIGVITDTLVITELRGVRVVQIP